MRLKIPFVQDFSYFFYQHPTIIIKFYYFLFVKLLLTIESSSTNASTYLPFLVSFQPGFISLCRYAHMQYEFSHSLLYFHHIHGKNTIWISPRYIDQFLGNKNPIRALNFKCNFLPRPLLEKRNSLILLSLWTATSPNGERRSIRLDEETQSSILLTALNWWMKQHPSIYPIRCNSWWMQHIKFDCIMICTRETEAFRQSIAVHWHSHPVQPPVI